jgi:hypothetical protein
VGVSDDRAPATTAPVNVWAWRSLAQPVASFVGAVTDARAPAARGAMMRAAP